MSGDAFRPGDNINLADIGRNYPAKPRRPERTKASTSITEEREARMWDALSGEAKARIKDDAKAAAARIMAERMER